MPTVCSWVPLPITAAKRPLLLLPPALHLLTTCPPEPLLQPRQRPQAASHSNRHRFLTVRGCVRCLALKLACALSAPATDTTGGAGTAPRPSAEASCEHPQNRRKNSAASESDTSTAARTLRNRERECTPSAGLACSDCCLSSPDDVCEPDESRHKMDVLAASAAQSCPQPAPMQAGPALASIRSRIAVSARLDCVWLCRSPLAALQMT